MTKSKKSESTADEITYRFASGNEAWKFARACEEGGHVAGFPGLREPTVRVLVRTWMEREALDALAIGAEVVGYQFANERA
jgi:hypothetical protein